MTTNDSLRIAQDALDAAREAYTQGRLTDTRRHLRLLACEAESASHALNIKIAETP